MALLTFVRLRIGAAGIDAWLSFWGCIVGAATVPSFAMATIWQHAATRSEFFIGTSAALAAGLLLLLLAILARQVHIAVREGRAPWRSRRWELFSHAIGLVVVGALGWVLMDIAPAITALVTGALLILCQYLAILCLGCWSTISVTGLMQNGSA